VREKRKRKRSISNSIDSFRETRSIPGNEYLNLENDYQQIGDLMMNLIEILPVKHRKVK